MQFSISLKQVLLLSVATIGLSACNSGVSSTSTQQTLTISHTATAKILQDTVTNSAINFTSIAKGNGVYVVVGGNGSILVSNDGTNWNSQDSGVSVDLHSVVFSSSNNLFYAVGDDSTVLSSPDGKVWTLYNQLTPINNLHSMVAVNGYLVIGAESSEIYEINLSGRGAVTVRNTVDNMKLISASANNDTIILGSSDGSILYKKISQLSSANWNRATKFSGSINSLAFSSIDNWFIAATSNGSVMRSSDGITGWSTPIFASTNGLNSITIDPLSSDFVAVGQTGKSSNIVSSANFNSWIYSAESYPVNLNQIRCFESDCFIVGDQNLILKSATRSSSTAPTWQTVNTGIKYAFISNYASNSISACLLNSSGDFSSCSSSNPGNLNKPNGIALTANYAYIANYGSNTMVHCPINKQGLMDACIPDDGIFNGPTNPVVYNGRLYVVNHTSKSISSCVINDDGSLGTCINNPTYFGPNGVAIANGYAYVLINYSNTIQIFKIQADGSLTDATIWSGFSAQNSIYISNNIAYLAGGNKVYTCPITTGKLGTCTLSAPVSGTYGDPNTLVINNGKAYIDDFNNNKVYVCSLLANGNINACTTSSNEFNVPNGLIAISGNN